jgi:hypothetical protein
MAIQIRYPSINAVSVQLSASRGSPAKLFVTGGSAGGIPFSGRQIGSGSEIGIGRNFTITEYIDNSVYLDQNNIILFRRGMPSRPVTACADVTLPQVIIQGNSSGASVTFQDVLVRICVERLAGTDTLGVEDWAESPCAGSQARYPASNALSIIGAPGGGSFLCSYEGQYRSVLASIYADMGCAYWWNFASGGIGKICSAGGGDRGIQVGCDITSSVSGSTLDGTRSHGSFTYARSPTEEIRSTNFTKTDWETFEVSAYKGLIYPTYDEILRSIWGGIDAYNDIAYGIPPSTDYINSTLIGLPELNSDDLITAFQQKFSWDPSKSPSKNWSKILGLPDIRFDVWGGVQSGDEVTAGTCFLARKAPPKFFRKTQLELFYPYKKVSRSYKDKQSSNISLKVKNTTITVVPEAVARGFDACGTTTEDIIGDASYGLWRSGQLWSRDDAEEGITDFSNSILNLNLQESIADCVVAVNFEPWLWLEAIKISRYIESTADPITQSSIFNDYLEGEMAGTLRYLQKRGWSIVWVRPPRFAVDINGITDINCNDLQSVAGYISPNDITQDPKPIEDQNNEGADAEGTCTSEVQRWLDAYGTIGEEDVQANRDYKPGLLSAVARGVTIACGNASKSVIFPSEHGIRVVAKIVSSFEVTARLNAGSVGQGGWASAGSMSGSSLQHTVSVTDVTADNAGGVTNIPNNSGGGVIGYSKYNAIDFCCPIDGFLESLSASIGPEGVSVSYAYRGLSPAPGITQVRQNNKTISRGSVTV